MRCGERLAHMLTRADSALGKAMEKVGGLVHSPALVQKGHLKREAGPSGEDADAPVAN